MLSIITPAYNNPDKLRKFLESVESGRRSCPDNVEVIVVDDSSTVDLGPVINGFSGVKYLRLEGHPGPAAARNRGARESNGEHLLFFDSDVILKADTLKAFCGDFARGETAVAGEYDIEPVEKGFFAQFKALLTESWTPRSGYVSVFALRAAGIRKDAFDRVGGFDENIKTASVEDFEFGQRLTKAGIPIAYDPNIVVRHHHPSFAKQMKLFYLRSRDWTELFMRRGGKFDNWCASPSEGIASISGAFFLISIAPAVFSGNNILFSASLISFIVYAAMNAGFIRIAYKRRGAGFVPAALLIKLPLALMVTLGFAAGVFRFMTAISRRKRRRP
ncbi:MAG: glycosyltransferase [Candidatus Omnitrophota bacterium]